MPNTFGHVHGCVCGVPTPTTPTTVVGTTLEGYYTDPTSRGHGSVKGVGCKSRTVSYQMSVMFYLSLVGISLVGGATTTSTPCQKATGTR